MSESTKIFLATAIPSGIVFVILCSTCLACCCLTCCSKIKQKQDDKKKPTEASMVEETAKVVGEETKVVGEETIEMNPFSR